MKFHSLAPFVPSGKDFDAAKQLFQEIGFKVAWDAGDYASLEKDDCTFILQRFDNVEFAQNFMITVKIEDADVFWKEMSEKKLSEKFGVKLSEPKDQPYGKEVNLIDIAGVCWHFVE